MSLTLGQRSFDDLGTPLVETTFCVIDLETTGGSPIDCAITEVGAVKLCGGQCLGTFQTLVNPGLDIPPSITVLTGITSAMVAPAPLITQVLPSLLEFIGGSVIVGHNIRFDISFLDAALTRSDRARLPNRRVDTAGLARRLVRDEVPNCRLGTLAARFRLDHRPTHRALDDALATGDLLHVLLERAAAFGVFGLDDLLALPTMAGHAQAPKLSMTATLPRQPGVYRFLDAAGRILYVGKAANLRSRVRSYFSTDSRRKVGGLLREAQRIEYDECAHSLEAAVVEIRQIHDHLPRYNRHGTRATAASYVKLTSEPFPRLSIVRSVRDDAAVYLGPLTSRRVAARVVEAIESVIPIRRCTADPRRGRPAPCASAQLGVSTCPCAGAITEADYQPIADRVRAALRADHREILDTLHDRMQTLALAERYEEAADVRDRGSAYADAILRIRRIDQLRRAGRVAFHFVDGGAELVGGRLVSAWDRSGELRIALDGRDLDAPRLPVSDLSRPARGDEADELLVVAGWLERNAHRIRIDEVTGVLSSALPRPRTFRPPR